jgi:hypothetical protein
MMETDGCGMPAKLARGCLAQTILKLTRLTRWDAIDRDVCSIGHAELTDRLVVVGTETGKID